LILPATFLAGWLYSEEQVINILQESFYFPVWFDLETFVDHRTSLTKATTPLLYKSVATGLDINAIGGYLKKLIA
jgi:hypothetical protein